MIRIAIFNGPNLALLGRREPAVYGTMTLEDIREKVEARAAEIGEVKISWFQSDIEGELVHAIGKTMGKMDALIVNPAAYTHTSIAIRDAITATGLPCVEVHLSNIFKREEFRHHSYVSPVSYGVLTGFGYYGYIMALEALVQRLDNRK